MKKSIIFPGQGSQQVGMGKDIYTNFLSGREVFQEIDDSLSQKLSKIIFEGPIEELTLTKNAQPAIMAVSMAFIKVLEKEFGLDINKNIDFLAGHSLGEYTALAASNALSIKNVSMLLKKRGESMQNAVNSDKTGMAALIGADINTIKNLLDRVKGENVLEIANYNTLNQIVISGDIFAINKAINEAKNNKIKAISLPVSAPFNCAYMKGTGKLLKDIFDNLNFTFPATKIISNYSALPFLNLEDMKFCLYKQTFSTVMWYKIIEFMKSKAVTKIVEVGHGNILTNMLRKDKNLHCSATVSLKGLEDIAKELL